MSRSNTLGGCFLIRQMQMFVSSRYTQSSPSRSSCGGCPRSARKSSLNAARPSRTDPRDRFQSAEQFSAALNAWLDEHPVELTPSRSPLRTAYTHASFAGPTARLDLSPVSRVPSTRDAAPPRAAVAAAAASGPLPTTRLTTELGVASRRRTPAWLSWAGLEHPRAGWRRARHAPRATARPPRPSARSRAPAPRADRPPVRYQAVKRCAEGLPCRWTERSASARPWPRYAPAGARRRAEFDARSVQRRSPSER